MKKSKYTGAILRIQHEEQKISLEPKMVIEESRKMTSFLSNLLTELREQIRQTGFTDPSEEIDFFRNIKPHLLGKLIYYNKVYRIETSCPVKSGKLYYKYFGAELEGLKQEYKEHICNSEFYRYYKSGRTDFDHWYFQLGNIDYIGGLNSFVFEVDPLFSTYYDNKVSRIIANDLLYNYLLIRINPDGITESPILPDSDSRDIYWTDSKSALVELIYAIYASRAISNGRIGISKLSLVFQILFQVQLGDLHHTFHRMKERAGSRTLFIDHLKESLEQYMNKTL